MAMGMVKSESDGNKQIDAAAAKAEIVSVLEAM